MSALQAIAIAIVAITGTAVVMVPVPVRQTLVLSIYGFALTVLFFSFQAPDVALSEIVISGVALPLIILATLRSLLDAREEQDQDGKGGAGPPERSARTDGNGRE